jgi:hypothetical protein
MQTEQDASAWRRGVPLPTTKGTQKSTTHAWPVPSRRHHVTFLMRLYRRVSGLGGGARRSSSAQSRGADMSPGSCRFRFSKAQRAGVQAGCSLSQARTIMPQAVVLPNSPSLVAAAWQRVLEALSRLSPRVESIWCGMALLHLDATDAIKPLLQDWTAHGGVADDRSSAELAALTAVAGTLHVVPAGPLQYILERSAAASTRRGRA